MTKNDTSILTEEKFGRFGKGLPNASMPNFVLSRVYDILIPIWARDLDNIF